MPTTMSTITAGFSTILAIAGGGALGALGRYYVMSFVGRFTGHGFPWGTLCVNILGSALMGILIHELAVRAPVAGEWRAFLAVGVVGAFTTFSTFSLDAVVLIERGEIWAALGYVMSSVVLCIGGLWLGLTLARGLHP